jgi:hypothetical protein
MDGKERYRQFAMKAESLVKPVDSTAISFLGDFNKRLPMGVQRRLMASGTRKIPYMGFIVDPYCFFLCYPVVDAGAARAMLPEGYELADTALFEGDPKRPSVVISCFSVRTSVFAGMRVECYLIARRRDTGRMAWIIVDYETNTSSHDPKQGFCGHSLDRALHATTPYGELLVEAENPRRGNALSLAADIREGRPRRLDEGLWVEGNMAVDYGGRLRDPSSAPFSLVFEPELMAEALEIDLASVEIEANSFLEGVIDGAEPSAAALFPYAQHFVIRQDLGEQRIETAEDLRAQVRTFLDREGFKIMSGDDIKKPLGRSLIVSFLVNAAIIATLFILALR